MSDQSQSWLRRLLGKTRSESSNGSESMEHDHADCSDIRESASDFVDGDMPGSLSDRIKQHLGICDNCDSWVKTFAATVGLIKDIPQEQPPESLMQKIKDIPRSNS